MSMTLMKKRLIDLILERTFRFTERPTFKLTSGKKSSFYFNCKPTTLNSEGMFLTGHLMYDIIRRRKTWNVQAVGGLTLGADPVATAIVYTAHIQGDALEAFIVRKERKKHGTMSWIEGHIKEGDTVIIIEDVITTGSSTMKAITRARESGLNVAGVVAFIDRQEGGSEAVKSMGLPFKALLTKEEIFRAFKKSSRS
jgi:orotate phosphoribosyltransferase